MKKKSEPLRVRLNALDEANVNELITRSGLDGSAIGRAAVRLLYAEYKRRGSVGFILDELSDTQFAEFLKQLTLESHPNARLNEAPPLKR